MNPTTRAWASVSKKSPCPVCGKASWCQVAAGGAVVMCREQRDGAFKVKRDRNGATYYLHRIAGTIPPPSSYPPPPRTRAADPHTIHEVYSALLARLSLSPGDRQANRDRGLNDEDLVRLRYASLPARGRARIVRDLRERFGDGLAGVPGFVRKEGEGGPYLTVAGAPGLIIPVRDASGQVTALKVRRSEDTGRGGPRWTYLSSARHGGPGPGSPVHVPLGTPTPSEVVRLTEGERKADVCFRRTGLATVGVPGVANWRPSLDVLRGMGAKTVRLAFDADARAKRPVAEALRACKEGLAEAGFAVELERWDAAYKGLDDLLAAGREPEVLAGGEADAALKEILAAAGCPPRDSGDGRDARDSGDDLVARVADGGADALFSDPAALDRLAVMAAADPASFASVKARLKGLVSLRDLERVLKPLVRNARKNVKTPGSEATGAPAYVVEDGRLCWLRATPYGGEVVVPLANFDARITSQVVHDDGAEPRRYFTVEGRLADGRDLPPVPVAADEFHLMNWPLTEWGLPVVVYAGAGTRDHLRAAIQLRSGDAPRETIYTHTGWREIDGKPVYLHGGGAIGAGGPVPGVQVHLPSQFANYVLPDPPTGDRLREAVRASLGQLRGLAPDRAAFLVLVMAYRAALGRADYSAGLFGETGAGKTELSALAQQHYGPAMDARNLPASWASTANALEAQAFLAKDALLVVDDFNPAGGDPVQLRRAADRLIRSAGNGAGRDRLTADASLKPQRRPRGLVALTGEDYPGGRSAMARVWAVDVPKKEGVNFDRLTECQRDAAAGLYAAALAGWVRWLARNPDRRAGFCAEVVRLRGELAATGGHSRVPTTAADLLAALDLFLEFATEAGAVDDAEKDGLRERGRRAFVSTAEAQADHQRDADPAERFLSLVVSTLSSGRAHLAPRDGSHPVGDAFAALGWRPSEDKLGTWRPQGRRVGWLDGDRVYLDPDAALAEAVKLADEQGVGLVVSPRTLWRHLHEAGRLAEVDTRTPGRVRFKPRRKVEGVTKEVLVFHAETFLPSGECPECPPDGNGRVFKGETSDDPLKTGHSAAAGRVSSPPPWVDTPGADGHPVGGKCPPATVSVQDGSAGTGHTGHSPRVKGPTGRKQTPKRHEVDL